MATSNFILISNRKKKIFFSVSPGSRKITPQWHLQVSTNQSGSLVMLDSRMRSSPMGGDVWFLNETKDEPWLMTGIILWQELKLGLR